MPAKKTTEPDPGAQDTAPAPTPEPEPALVKVVFTGPFPMIVDPLGALEPGQVIEMGPERAKRFLGSSPYFTAV